MPAALTTDQVSKTYTKLRALDRVSLSVAAGERLALIGASGSGKSTLIRIAAGLLQADRGSGPVQVLGREVQSNGRLARDVRAVRARIGMVSQQFNLVQRLPVVTNVLVGALSRTPRWRAALGRFSRAEQIAAMQALAEVGVADHAGKRAQRLSGGQQQRVAIARCLMQKAELILADEPIASLDPKSAKRVMDLLVDLNERLGIALVCSLHQVDYATSYFHRVVAMRDGRIVYDGPASRLTTGFLTQIYGASVDELILPGQIGPAPAPQERPLAVPPPAVAASLVS